MDTFLLLSLVTIQSFEQKSSESEYLHFMVFFCFLKIFLSLKGLIFCQKKALIKQKVPLISFHASQ